MRFETIVMPDEFAEELFDSVRFSGMGAIDVVEFKLYHIVM